MKLTHDSALIVESGRRADVQQLRLFNRPQSMSRHALIMNKVAAS